MNWSHEKKCIIWSGNTFLHLLVFTAFTLSNCHQVLEVYRFRFSHNLSVKIVLQNKYIGKICFKVKL